MTSLVYGANKKHEGNRSTRNLSVALSPEQQKKEEYHEVFYFQTAESDKQR